jgi:hypothetical protein
VTELSDARAAAQPEPQLQGGGTGGRGPGGDDESHRRPDRNDGEGKRLLIALGILAVGAGVMSARLLSKAGRLPRFS